MKELGRKRCREEAQLAADGGGMCVLHFLPSAEVHHTASRRCNACVALTKPFSTLWSVYSARWMALGKPGMLPCMPFQLPTSQLGPTARLGRLCFIEWSAKRLDYGLQFPEVFFNLPKIVTPATSHTCPCLFLSAGYEVWLLQCVCIQGFSSLDCFSTFIMKVTPT